jgi:gluconolactonase
MPDGSILLVEIKRGTVTRVATDGSVEVVAELGGGPNGLAIGPDGAAYVCNNGGCFEWHEVMGLTLPGPFKQELYSAGGSSGWTSPRGR